MLTDSGWSSGGWVDFTGESLLRRSKLAWNVFSLSEMWPLTWKGHSYFSSLWHFELPATYCYCCWCWGPSPVSADDSENILVHVYSNIPSSNKALHILSDHIDWHYARYTLLNAWLKTINCTLHGNWGDRGSGGRSGCPNVRRDSGLIPTLHVMVVVSLGKTRECVWLLYLWGGG